MVGSTPTMVQDSGRLVVITGAAGFIGGHLAERLMQRGDRVIGIDNLSDYYDVRFKRETLAILDKYNDVSSASTAENKRFKFYECDISNREHLFEVFRMEGKTEKNSGVPSKITTVVHLAARAGVRYSVENPCKVMTANVYGTEVILEAVQTFSVSYAVCASSSSVYGLDSIAPFSEDQICDHPISPYAASKRANEMQAYAWSHLHNIPVTMLRFFTVYGPRGRPDMAAFKFINKISQGEKIDKFGDGSMIREFTYVDDIVNGVILCIDKPPKTAANAKAAYRTMNLGGGSTHTLNEFIETIEKHVGSKAIINPMPMQPGDVLVTSACQNLALSEVGFKPQISLDEGIRRTVEWYKNCPYLK